MKASRSRRIPDGLTAFRTTSATAASGLDPETGAITSDTISTDGIPVPRTTWDAADAMMLWPRGSFVAATVYAVGVAGGAVKLQLLSYSEADKSDTPVVIAEIAPLSAGQYALPIDSELLNALGTVWLHTKAVVPSTSTITYEASLADVKMSGN